MGAVQYFLGVELRYLKNQMVLTQHGYLETVLKKFGMTECNPVRSPIIPGQEWSPSEGEASIAVPFKEAIGALLFLSKRTRPDISFAVGMRSRFAVASQANHWMGIKRIMQYLNGTASFGLMYGKGEGDSENPLKELLNASSDAQTALDVV